MTTKTEVFFPTDIEADGPIPGDYSMLSFASVAVAEDGKILGSFEANLQPLPTASQDPRTMREFWSKEPEAWEYVTRNPRKPESAMMQYVKWVDSIPGDLKTMVCMPSGFDFLFMYWYMKKFAKSPFSFSCVDMKTYVMGTRKKPYRYCGKRSWPKRWFAALPHTHKAIDDALEQGFSWMMMRTENLAGALAREEEMSKVKFNMMESWKTCPKISLVGERRDSDPVPEIILP